MYPTYRDTQPYILNNKVIIQQVVMEWKMEKSKYPHFFWKRGPYGFEMWITVPDETLVVQKYP